MTVLPISPTDLAAVMAPFGEAVSLPPVAYHDALVFAEEQARIFDQSWLCVGREEDVALPGQWFLASIVPEGILVVRGADLHLRAFYNVCRHRGVTLQDASCPRGRDSHLRCPYHGWTYELTGALRAAPNALPTFDRGAHALASVRVDVWQGFVFVNLAPDGPTLIEALGEPPPWLVEAPLAQAKRAHAAEYEVLANWKLLVENFQESDHFTRIHPSLERLTPNAAARSVLSPDGPWLGGTMTFADDVETVSTTGKRQGRAFLASSGYRRQVSDAMLFPTLLTSLQPDYLLTYRLTPLSPSRTRVVAETFVHPTTMTSSVDLSDVLSFWETVNAEDRAICERQQIGVQSRSARASRYSTVEDGVHAFDRRVAAVYRS